MTTYKKHIIAIALAAAITTPVVSAQEFADVYTPPIPSSTSICGKKVSLESLDYAERYDRELTSLIYTHGNTLLMLKRANRYFPQIAPILKEQGVHSDLLYLACVESTLNPRAVSPAKAAGIWQFMPATAKEYGLEVNDEVDERYNIEKATVAACKYFKKAYRKFGDWNAVFAAFNGGMNRISTQLTDQLTENALDLYLADETQRYPFRIMATKAIMEDPAKYGFNLTAESLHQPREVKIETVTGPVASWAQWAKDRGISYRDLREENPWIRAPKLTNKAGKTYKVRVPLKKSLMRSTASKKVYNPKWISR